MRDLFSYIKEAGLFFLSVIILITCTRTSKLTEVTDSENVEKTLTIYCENSMVPLLLDLKTDFEKKYNCKLKLVNDCSQNLIGLINYTKQGDLFLPESQSAIGQLDRYSSVYITDSAFVGYNRLILLVKKHNPHNFTGNLMQLTEKGISIILANPETSSLGYQTKRMLTLLGIYNDVIKNVISLSVDSKGLLSYVANGQADIAITWESDLYQYQRNELIDPVAVTNEYSSEVYAGILSCSQNPILAKYFIDFVSSEDGSAIAKKYGINKRKSQIF